MVDKEANKALLSAYRHSIFRYERLLNTYVTEVERDYIMHRLAACRAAIKALIEPESRTVWASYRVERREYTVDSH